MFTAELAVEPKTVSGLSMLTAADAAAEVFRNCLLPVVFIVRRPFILNSLSVVTVVINGRSDGHLYEFK